MADIVCIFFVRFRLLLS